MKGFNFNGNNVTIVKYDEKNLQTKLPPAIYSVMYNKLIGFYLVKNGEFFDIEKNIFSIVEKRSKKVIDKYLSGNDNLGVLLTGLKGAGKSYLMKYISNKMLEMGYPVISIESPFTGEEFNSFINDLGDVVILFDEFGKVYKNDDRDDNRQEKLLSLFDGINSNESGKKLFILSENYKFMIDDFFISRPSRIYYRFDYVKIDDKSIDEFLNHYLNDELLSNKKFIENLKDSIGAIKDVSFDILKAIVEECNLYKEDALNNLHQLISDLNIEFLVDYNTGGFKLVEIIDKEFNNKPCKIIFDKNKTYNFGDVLSYEVKVNGNEKTIRRNIRLREKYVLYENNDHIIYRYENEDDIMMEGEPTFTVDVIMKRNKENKLNISNYKKLLQQYVA